MRAEEGETHLESKRRNRVRRRFLHRALVDEVVGELAGFLQVEVVLFACGSGTEVKVDEGVCERRRRRGGTTVSKAGDCAEEQDRKKRRTNEADLDVPFERESERRSLLLLVNILPQLVALLQKTQDEAVLRCCFGCERGRRYVGIGSAIVGKRRRGMGRTGSTLSFIDVSCNE
jgi:hypothetical protein